MHYQRSKRFGDTNLVSEISSADFFISPNGPTDSLAELEATLKAFFDEPGDVPDEHAQCKFVARYNWLRKTLDWSGHLPPQITCKNYDAWSMQGKVESLSLIFATGYLSNPASFYGHILLKFNSSRSTVANDYLDQSINFGAIVPQNENGLIYIFKGLFGGYDATFSNAQFYRINHTYAESELRDLWEYRLNLDEDQVKQIVDHSWELLGKNFKYYFAKKNCAYRMGELLELVVERPILPDELPWAMPGTIFNRIELMQTNGAPLVQNVSLIPSRLNSYHSSFSLLSDEQKSIAKKLSVRELNFDDPTYSALSAQDRVPIIDTLLDYSEFRLVGDKSNSDLKEMKRRMLVERIKLPSQDSNLGEPERTFPDSSPPHKAPLPVMIRAAALHNSLLGRGTSFQFRPAYFDVLEPNAGRVPDSQLTMFDLNAVYLDGGISLRNLNLIDVESMSVGRTPLAGDGGYAWELLAGLRNKDAGCSRCLVLNTTAGIGKAYEIPYGLVVYGMSDIFAQSGYHGPPQYGIEPRLGVIATPRPFWKVQISAGQYRYFNTPVENRRHLRWENRFGTSRDWDIRINLEQNLARELQIAISTYW